MWRLKMADPGEPWSEGGDYESVRTAAAKIIELEGYPVSAIFFNLMIDTKANTDENAFEYLMHTGYRTGRSYAIKRVVQ